MATKTENNCINDQLDILQSELQEIKAKLMILNVKSAILNINLVSFHDPKVERKMREDANICNACLDKCEQRLKDDKQHIQYTNEAKYNETTRKIKLIVKNPEE